MSEGVTARIKVFPEKKYSKTVNGKVLKLPLGFEDLKEEIGKAFNCEVTSILTEDGAELNDITFIRDNDILIYQEKINGQANLNEWIVLNIGGKKFMTTRGTIVTNEPDSMLAKMLNDDEGVSWKNSRDATRTYLIDRAPEYFLPILNFLRTNTLTLDNNTSAAGVLEEAKFFGIQSIIKPLEELVERDNVDGYSPITRREFIIMLMSKPLQSQLRCQGLNFLRIDLSKLDLRYVNFRMANLEDANLSEADLSYANMERADLKGAKMDHATLIGTKLMHANLENASLTHCDFEDSRGVVANLECANLRGADLSYSKLNRVNLRVACLKNAILKHCSLQKTDLAGADLEFCDMSYCELHEANLRGANVKNTNFDAILSPLHMSQCLDTTRR